MSERPQNADTSSSAASGAQLFAETIAAHGGKAFLRLQTLKMTGKGEFTTPPQTGGLTVRLASFTFYIAMEGRSRLEARLPGGSLLFVSRGNDRGGFVVLAGRTLPLPADQTNGIEPIGLLRTTMSKGYRVVAAAEEILDGKTLLGYDIQREDGSVARAFIDSDTKLLRKTVSKTSRGEMTVLLTDYRSVDGIDIFGEIELLENGASVLKLMASEITLDEPLKDSLFETR